ERRAAARLSSVQDVPDLRQAAVRAFVTGGTGFVGAHLVQALRAQGDAVTCLVRTPAKARALGWTDARLVVGDLDDARALRGGGAGAGDGVFLDHRAPADRVRRTGSRGAQAVQAGEARARPGVR